MLVSAVLVPDGVDGTEVVSVIGVVIAVLLGTETVADAFVPPTVAAIIVVLGATAVAALEESEAGAVLDVPGVDVADDILEGVVCPPSTAVLAAVPGVAALEVSEAGAVLDVPGAGVADDVLEGVVCPPPADPFPVDVVSAVSAPVAAGVALIVFPEEVSPALGCFPCCCTDCVPAGLFCVCC